jgi:16S rRNA (guanine966-N2)-methyltransferase
MAKRRGAKAAGMSLRIVGGALGSRKIDTPDTSRTHPMGDRIRSALFNKIMSDVPGAIVLDAFAGSGALGIEALSRGADHATFIERDRIAQKVITKNIQQLGIDERAKLIRASVSAWLETAGDQQFDIIFVDPPYHDMQLSTVLRLMDLLKPGALMVLSHPGRSESPTKPGVVVVDNRSYGDAALTFYRREVSN